MKIDRAAVAEFWHHHGPDLGGGDVPDQFWFGDSPELADALAQLVVSGPKRATAGLLSDVDAEGAPMPEPGQRWIVVDGSGVPVAVIRTTEVRVGPLSSVDDQFAWDEGEGDRTRAWWLEAHLAYFRRSAQREGRELEADPQVVFERFELVGAPTSK